MDDYLRNVYLKRINKQGTNRQDRIKTKKENEFEKLFLPKSEYKVCIYQVNDTMTNIIGSLQPNRWNENNIISNLLLPVSSNLKTGDLLYIKHIIKKEQQDRIWLVIFVEDNLTKGYRLFKVICLNDDVSITDKYGNSIFSCPVRFTNLSQSIVQDSMARSKSEKGYREPQGNRIFITQDNENLKKGTYFEYKNRGWEIVGKDDISYDGSITDNVAYVYMSERLLSPPEPISSQSIPVGEDENFFLIGG